MVILINNEELQHCFKRIFFKFLSKIAAVIIREQIN